ncbi:hypothetical protein Tco_1084657 [Tanacetum coccineum]
MLGVKDKPQVGSLSPRKWRTRDMIVAAKHGDKVLNVQPVSEFNPTTGIQVLKPLVVEKPGKVKDKALVKKPADVVEKPEKVKDKAMVKKPADVVEKPVTVVVKDKATVKKPAVVAMVKKPANVVEKPAVLVKEKDKDKAQVSIVKENDVVPDVGLEKVVSNDKELSDFVSNKRRRRTELPKLNAPADVADKESDVMNNKDKESDVADKELDVDKDKFGANELFSDVVSKKRRRRTELPKVNALAAMADKPLVEKSVVKAAVKPAVKRAVKAALKPAVKRAVKAALKPAVKGNESKKLKSKSGMKRKIKNSSDSLSSSVDEKELRCLLKKLKYVKQEDSDESVSDRKMKYKKNEKELTPSEVAHEEYLKHFLTLRARAVPKSLFAAIRGSKVYMWSFLSEIGFNSFHNLAIDEIPSRVGRVAGLKGEICLDVVRRLREDSDISKIDWCGYIHTIRAWNSTLMRQREKLELKEHVLGLLELHDESTGGGSMLTTEKENLIKKAEEKLSIVCSERFGCSRNSLGDDGNGGDDYDNVDGNDSSVTDKEVHVEDDGNRVVDGNRDVQDDNGGSKKQGDARDAINLDIVLNHIEHVFETSSGLEKVFGIRLNMETLAPGLWIDANVVDCWSEVLNYEERFRKAGSLSRHFFPTGCITLSMFDGTYATDEERWENFSAQVSAQFKDNVNGLALNGIDLKKLYTRSLMMVKLLQIGIVVVSEIEVASSACCEALRFKFATRFVTRD